MARHERVYMDAKEEGKRLEIFENNVEIIEFFKKAGNKPYKLGVNQFADLTNEEFKLRKGHLAVEDTFSTGTSSFKYENVPVVPSSLDWRIEGAVTPVKDQFECAQGDYAAMITGYENVPSNNESALLNAVANQPASVSIGDGGHGFQFYKSGVFAEGCDTARNHALTIVGYGTRDDGIKYWLGKNSWGTGWGGGGQIRMQRDIDTKEGMCGLAIMPTYPTIY
ncbi:hypothetical protein RHMOL_Rhmol10G0104200 [Rhododendron molle]|uniref:Uncharacterized protein n=1 Tax=Rhododendron molle TaxID=49168 RepID=A0ACC0M0P9_RHOML|nr:hypothetical protein RHMOL_Rhmol10G0104200 [Rhododendron molle]